MAAGLRRTQRLSDCGLSSSVYQRCFYDDFPSHNEKVKFYIGEHDPVDDEEWFPEEECLPGLSRLLKDNLMCQIKYLFGVEVGGLSKLMPSIVNQILFLAEDEPYGVRGANVVVDLERPFLARKSSTMSTTSSSTSIVSDGAGESDVINLGQVKMCKDTVTTFNLILTFKTERNVGVAIRNWMANLVRSKPVVVIESNFTLRKRRLYRSN